MFVAADDPNKQTNKQTGNETLMGCVAVHIFAYSSTHEQSNKTSRDWKQRARLGRDALRACEARALGARKTVTPRFTDCFTDFEKKGQFCSLLYPRCQKLFRRGFRFRSSRKEPLDQRKASGPERHPFDSAEPITTPLVIGSLEISNVSNALIGLQSQ